MRRTALSCAAVFITAATCLYLFGIKAVLILGIGLCLLAVLLVLLSRKNILTVKSMWVLSVGAVFCFYLMFFTQGKISDAKSLAGTEQTVTVRVVEEPSFHSGYIGLTAETVQNIKVNGKTLSKQRFNFNISTDFDIKAGDILRAELVFSELNSNYKRLKYPDRIYVSAYCKSAEIMGHKDSVYTYCIVLRQKIRSAIEQYTDGDVSALLEGVLLGDISLMSDELYEDFKITGVAHITAVSGMHIGALCVMITSLLGRYLGRRKSSLLAMFPMVVVVMLAGFTPSAVRSGIMCLIILSAQCLLKKADGLNSLGVAIVVMLCYNPFYICSLSFQLSCSAAAGVILISPFSERVSNRIVHFEIKYVSLVSKETVKLFIQSIGAVVCTLPFQIFSFGYISLIAPVANIFICAASVYMMALTILGVMFCYFPFLSLLAKIIFSLTRLLAEYTTVMVGVLSEIPFSYIPFGNYEALLWVGLSMALCAVWVFLGRPGHNRLIAILMFALLLLTLWTNIIFDESLVEVAAISTGNGFCAVVSYKDTCVIIGCGDDYSDSFTVTDYLKKHGIKTVEQLLILSDADTCFNGYHSLTENLKIEKTAVPYNFKKTDILKGDAQTLKNGEVLHLLNGKIKAEPIFVENGCIYKITVFEKCFIVSSYAFDTETPEVETVDFIVTSRALPENLKCKFAVVSAENDGCLVSGADRTYTTRDRTLSVKLKKGKGMTIYAY